MSTATHGSKSGWADVRVDRIGSEPTGRGRPAAFDGELRGLLVILAFSLFALAWMALLRGVRAGLPGESVDAPRGSAAVAERLADGGPTRGAPPR